MPDLARSRVEGAPSLQTWSTVRAFMLKTSGVSFTDEQIYLLEARLGPVAKYHRFASLDEYVSAAVASGERAPLGQSLIDAMTTHETFFFRDTPFWKAFEGDILPKLFASGKQALRVWSAACSHGQEAYSLVMLLEERWPELARSVSIVGTDVSPLAVDKAREGTYGAFEVNRGLGAQRMVRHLEQVAGGFRVKPHLRERVSWRVGNLLTDPIQHGAFDIVLCRNVLIYFGDADRRAVVDKLVASTRPGGYVGLGATEQIARRPQAPGWYPIAETRAP